MNVNIIRGQNQIGGNIIEVSTSSTKILLDVGLELDDEKNKELPNIDGLFDRKGYDAVFISHYHSDHVGLAYNICSDIPLYIGEMAYRVLSASNTYLNRDNLSPAGFLHSNEVIKIGDISVTPYLCDHSAFDSYMILVEADGEKVLYTGDFRSNGRKSYERLLKQLPTVDKLICEGTTLSRVGKKPITEQELEEKSVKLFCENNGPVFVLQSSMNIDRTVTMYRASKRSNRLFLQDLYMGEITNAIGGSIPNPMNFNDVKVFVTRPYAEEHFRYKLFNNYGNKKIGKSQIKNSHFTMCARTSMLTYLQSLSKQMSFENGLLIYSFWSGYKQQGEMKTFLKECENMGLKIVTLHTTGHADKQAILDLINSVKSKEIIPVHTENSEWFSEIRVNISN